MFKRKIFDTMSKKWIVLIGPPAVGKTTLSNQLKNHFNAKVYSFDEEFPLEWLKESLSDSKDGRKVFLEKIKADESEWIIVDDTCHLKSMQKRYLQASENENQKIDVVFLFISARTEQISELQERNSNRNSSVTNEEIEKMTKHFHDYDLEWPNLIEYNFKKLPCVEIILNDLREAFQNYKKCSIHRNIKIRDIESDTNFYNRLNLALNKEITSAFAKKRHLDGKTISKAKKEFLAVCDNADDIEDIVQDFRNKYLV